MSAGWAAPFPAEMRSLARPPSVDRGAANRVDEIAGNYRFDYDGQAV